MEMPPGMREPPLASSSSRDEEVTAPKRKLIDGDEVIDSPTRTKARRVVEEPGREDRVGVEERRRRVDDHDVREAVRVVAAVRVVDVGEEGDEGRARGAEG